MLKFLFILLIFVAINFTSLEAQGFNSSSIQNNNDNYQNNKFNNSYNYYKDSLNSEDSIYNRKNYPRYENIYQGNQNPTMSSQYINQSSNNYNERAEFNKPNNDYVNSFNSSIPITAPKKNVNFKDGKGVGYRVYDNSNRQSYFCNINPNLKKTFTHDNNFNGVYVGVGVAKIDSSINLSQTSTNTSFIGKGGVSNNPYKFDFSGSKTLPSIIIGQGRLFSSGLFLGQEFAMNIGEFNIGSNKINNNEYKKINYSFSNYSYYSGKFGFNIFKIFLPYVKLSLSTSSSRFILQKNDNSKVVSGGSFPSVGFGGGIDISIKDHIRAIIDYTEFTGSGDAFFLSSKSDQTTNIRNSVSYDSKYAFTRVSLIYRF